MKVFITGGGGMLGHRLARALATRGKLVDESGTLQAITQIKVFDTGFPAERDARLVYVQGDLAAPGALADAMDADTDTVFHLAAVVSAGAEAEFDLGMRINIEGTRTVLELCRRLNAPPRVLFTSSVAAFGGAMPDVLDDATTPTPQSSYGTQKVIGEYLVNDYTRKGFIDGRSMRLPTIVVRPGRPNLAASSFASSVLREPLNGEISKCPVADSTGVWLLSPARAIDAFMHAHDLPAAAWGSYRVVNLPGITATVREMVDALGRIAGRERAALVQDVPDERIRAIVKTWPTKLRTPRANAMGFKADPDIEAVIRAHIADHDIKL
ncbi:MAG: SDR family oxidoreductase [Betaproteobacteria bacterium]|nr:SDR family oxidoreductase [Betaproteobacteria bacterium]